MMQEIAAPPLATIAPLPNVIAFAELLDRLMNRTPGLPGMACFYGPSGFGKTCAAIYGANLHRAYHVQVKSAWTRKHLCQVILREMGIRPAGTIPEMIEEIGKQLSLSGRPLIIDEADLLVKKGMIEIVRDIYETSLAAIILIGEEGLPAMLKQWERVHGRMLDWVQALPGELKDVRHLVGRYCPRVEIADDLIQALCDASAGSVRRICVNLDLVREAAETQGLDKIGRADFKRNFFTGNPPGARRAA